MRKPRITMADIAETLQVSKMTVSRVLNNKPGVSEETRLRVTKVAESLGYSPRSQSPVNNTKVIALLIPNKPTAYLGEILKGIFNAAEQLNCSIMLYTQNLFTHAISPDNDFSSLRAGLVDGVLMVVPRDYETVVADLKQNRLPYVIVDHRSQTEEEASVTATNRKGMQEATRYLLALGHTRIGFITGRMDIACSHDRLDGYRDALAEVGLPFETDLVLQGDYSQPSGFEHTQQFLQCETPPTAILASNDMMAYGAMEAARVEGLTIGRDISIVGFDDIFLSSQVHPPLTTVRQPLVEMGETAFDMLVALLNDRPALTMRKELPTELVVRATTGRAL